MNTARLRDLAATLERDAGRLLADRLDNTPKRAKQAAAARIEGWHCQRAAKSLRALAIAADNGEVPIALHAAKVTKAAALEWTETVLDYSGGYYSIHDTGRFKDAGPVAVAFRALGEKRENKEEREARERESKIAAKVDRIRFVPIPGFFPTPPALVEQLISLADLAGGLTALEPSAGKGDIADALEAAGCEVVCVEVNPDLCDILELKGYPVTRGDFLELPTMEVFDRIVMNPPFENLTDINHVRHAFALLKPGGRLVSVMSPSAFFRTDKRAVRFRGWFAELEGQKYDVEPGAFKNGFNPTLTNCVIVTLEKPSHDLQDIQAELPELEGVCETPEDDRRAGLDLRGSRPPVQGVQQQPDLFSDSEGADDGV